MAHARRCVLLLAIAAGTLALQPAQPKNVSSLRAHPPQHHKQPTVVLLENSSMHVENGTTQQEPIEPIADFPQAPPVQLLAPAQPLDRPTLGGGPHTTSTLAFRTHRNFLTLTGRDLTLSTPDGKLLYTTKGDFWTMRSHTHFFGRGDGELAVISKPWFSWYTTYEVRSYVPLCPMQASDDADVNGKPLYLFARLTEYMFTFWEHWLVEHYNCDGSLTELWDLQARRMFGFYHQYDVRQRESRPARAAGAAAAGEIVGTIDQAYFFQWTPNYNVFVAKNVDQNLFAILTVMLDMAQKLKQDSKSSSSSSSSSSSHSSSGSRR